MVMRLYLFDLDHTILSKNSSHLYGRYLYQNKMISTPTVLYLLAAYSLHLLSIISLEKVHDLCFKKLFLNTPLEYHQRIAKQMIIEMLHEHLNQQIESVWKTMDKEEAKKIIVSSSPDFIVKEIANALKMDDYLASHYVTDDKGIFTHVGEVVSGKEKREFAESLACQYEIKKTNIFAFSDSHFDIPLLDYAGYAYAVNPDKRLRNYALKRGWEIIE